MTHSLSHTIPCWLRAVVISLLILLAGCNRRPSDVFLPIVIGEATAAPTILDTPVRTPTTTPTARSATPSPPAPTGTTATRIVTPAPVTATLAVTPLAGTRTAAVSASGTPGLLSPGAVTTPGAIAQPTITLAPTVTPTSLFRNYVALVVSQLQRTATPTATLLPVPIVLTPTPRPVTPTATALPTMTPTPFTGSVRLLNRDPVYEKDWIPAVAYVEPDSYFDKSWSTFYQAHPFNSDLVRIYTSDNARIYDPVLALMSTDQWAEGVCMVPSTMVGVQFRGDENDGWARVLVDGVERWRGNTYGRANEPFVHFLEVRDLHSAPHVIRIEPLGQVGTTLAGGNIHVSIYAVVCGLTVHTEIFVPILQR